MLLLRHCTNNTKPCAHYLHQLHACKANKSPSAPLRRHFADTKLTQIPTTLITIIHTMLHQAIAFAISQKHPINIPFYYSIFTIGQKIYYKNTLYHSNAKSNPNTQLQVEDTLEQTINALLTVSPKNYSSYKLINL